MNGLAPGGTDTEILQKWIDDTPGVIDANVAAIPLGRLVQPFEVARVAAFLLTDRAAMVTGAIIPVDGRTGA